MMSERAGVCRLLIETLIATGRPGDALRECDATLAAQPRMPGLLALRSLALLHLERFVDALEAAVLATTVEPRDGLGHVALGFAAVHTGRAGRALAAFDQAIALQPTLARAYAGRGLALAAIGRGEEAIGSYARSVELNPLDYSAFQDVGHLMLRVGRAANAHAAFRAALDLKPGHVPAEEGRIMSLIALNRFAEAAAGLAHLEVTAPWLDYLPGQRFHALLQCCEWREFDAMHRHILGRVRRGERVDPPWSFIAHGETPADQRRCAETYVADRCTPHASGVPRGRRKPGLRLRIAYLSSDFRSHPVAQLMAGVFEAHDRSRFETFGFSSGFNDGSELRQRVERGLEHFSEVASVQDRALAQSMADLSIDIAVDLGGHTTGGRTRVMAHRPAPVQIAFLGFPGTLGAPYIDYLVADRQVIPECAQPHYTEQPIFLPETYLLAEIPAPGPIPGRRAAGLPENGMIYCSFSAPYKLTPALFDCWMSILRAVPDSILWLRDMSDVAKANLAREAGSRGVDPSRLIYAPHTVNRAEYLARLSLADVFLDTSPYNAHTTATDALAAAVPVLTLCGSTFASRVATSLLHAAGLAHLSVSTLEEYERLAIQLACSGDARADLSAHLRRIRSTSPLFDTARFARCLEDAYLAVWARHERGESPAPLWVQPGRSHRWGAWANAGE